MGSKQILIIDDNAEFSTGLERLIKTMGHIAHSCSDLNIAKDKVIAQNYDFILIDCLMPTSDGFTVAKELSEIIERKKHTSQMIMMSGLIMDDNTQKDALSKDYISEFLVKPISKENLQDCFGEEKSRSSNITFLDDLSQVQDSNDLEALLVEKNHIDGVELAFLITHLSKFELSCKLEILNTEAAKPYTLNMQSGSLTNITSSEYSNSLGELLVGLNYLSREDLSSYISSDYFKKSSDPIGKALIKLNLISPHAIPIALKKQLHNRLSDLFILEESTFSFKKAETKIPDDKCSLNLYDIRLETSEFFKSEHIDFLLSEVSSYFESVSFKLSKTETPKEGVDLPDLDSAKFSNNELKTILSHVALNVITIISDSNNTESSLENTKQAVLNLISNIQERSVSNNPYEILGIPSENTSDQKISKAYQEIAKVIHPDKVSLSIDEADLSLAEKVFTKVSEAFNLIKTAENRTTYESAIKNKSTREKLNCNSILEASKVLLSKSEYPAAFKNLNTPEMYESSPKEFGLYLLWSALKSENTDKLKKPVEKILEEEKRTLSNDELYYYVKALHSIQSSDTEGFKKNINLSLKANPQFLPARREAQIVKSKLLEKKRASGKSSWFSFKKSS